MTNILPKIILAVFGIVAAIFVLIGISGSLESLEVTYEDNLLKIQNVGDKPVEIRGVTINDRSDCAVLNVMPQGNILKVGDSLVLMTLCSAVRTTITTADSSDTYYFKR